ncbi:MAG: GspH/FimT family pseudopilin [Rhodoferax sp.]|nr:GspH/FimT family pseudopilin [Rhodoferax sp.]
MLRPPSLGFSLIELMTTITILAILTAVVGPAIGSWMINTRTRSAAEAVLTGLQKTRMEAIRRNQTVTFWLVSSTDPTQFDSSCAASSASGSWVISSSDPSGKCSSNPDTKLAEFYDWHSAGKSSKDILIAAMDNAANAASSVKFDSLGQVVSSGNAIRTIDFTTNSDGTRRLRLLISSIGSARLCDRDAGATDPRAC